MEGDLCTEKPAEKRPFEKTGHRWWITLKLILNKSVMIAWI